MVLDRGLDFVSFYRCFGGTATGGPDLELLHRSASHRSSWMAGADRLEAVVCPRSGGITASRLYGLSPCGDYGVWELRRDPIHGSSDPDWSLCPSGDCSADSSLDADQRLGACHANHGNDHAVIGDH